MPISLWWLSIQQANLLLPPNLSFKEKKNTTGFRQERTDTRNA